MSLLRWLVFSAVVAGAAGAPAAARAGDVLVSVLGVEPTDAPEALAVQLTDALRQKVAASKGYQLVAGKDLVEIKLVFSCPDESPACMAQAAKSIGADKLLFGNVKKAISGDYVVSLKMLDASKGVVDSWIAETLAAKNATAGGVRGPVQKWFAALVGQNTTGALSVRSSVAGASILVDGEIVGTSGDKEVEIANVAAGRHRVRVDKPGFVAFDQDVTVKAGETLPVDARLAAGGAAVAAPPPFDPFAAGVEPKPAGPSGRRGGAVDHTDRGGYRTGFWVTLGAGVVSTALAIKYGRDVLTINDELDPYRRFSCSSSKTGLCDKSGKEVPRLTTAEQTRVAQLKDDGSRSQTLQWVFVGVGSAFGVASAYLLYRGFLDEGASSGERAQHGLRIFPVASSGHGGISAEFDF